MSDNSSPWGRSTVHVGAEGQPASGYEPRLAGSVGTSRRGTVYVGTTEEVRGPGLVSQEQAAGNDVNTVRYSDQGGKTRSVWVAERHAITEPDGRTPYKGGEITVRHVVDVAGVGQMRVQQAIALGLVKPADLNMPESAAPTKSLAMRQHEARERGEQPPVDPQVAQVEAALQSDYNATVTDLSKAMQSVGVSPDIVLNTLATGDASSLGDAAEKLATHMGHEQFTATVEALELRVLDAVDRALPQGVDLDAVVEALERPEHSKRWSQAWVTYLRSGDAGLVQQFAREIARAL